MKRRFHHFFSKRNSDNGRRVQSGSVLILALFAVAILSLLLASTLSICQNKYHTVFQAASWQEAVHGAEAGVDLAMDALNRGEWTGWQTGSNGGNPPPRTPPSTGATATAATGPPSPGSYNYRVMSLGHSGEGNQQVSAFITIDAAASLSNAPGGQWLRIRAIGITDLSGPMQVSSESKDRALRRLDFVTNRDTGGTVIKPQARRYVEAIAKRNTKGYAMMLRNAIKMGGGASFVDSFDSSDPNKSTLRLYDPLKRQSNGDIATLFSEGSDLKNAAVYGGVFYNGPPPKGTAGVKGTVSSGFNATLPPVRDPVAGWAPTASVTDILTTTTIIGGPKGAPARYKVNSIDLRGGSVLSVLPHAPGQESYVEIWVTGDMQTSGTALIVQDPGVHTIYYVDGNLRFKGGSLVNKSNIAANMTILGVDPPKGGLNKFEVTGNGNFIGVVNAPNYDFTITGAGDYCGALIGNSMLINNEAQIHYDEALNKTSSAYSVASWYEDLR